MIRSTAARRTFTAARSVRANAVQPVPKAEPLAVPPTGPPATQQPVIQPVVQSPTVQQIRVKRSIGGLRGGITGFLLGMTLAGGLGYAYLLQEYHNASALLLASVDELEQSTQRITGQVRRIEELERRVTKQDKQVATQKDHAGLRREMHNVYAQLNAEQLDLRSKYVELEKELHLARR